jgi:hypothetical protein
MSDLSYTERTSLPLDVKRRFYRQLLAAVSLGKYSQMQCVVEARDRKIAAAVAGTCCCCRHRLSLSSLPPLS